MADEVSQVSKSIGMLEERTENLEKTIVAQHAILNDKIDRVLTNMMKTTMSVSKAHDRIDMLTGEDGPITLLKKSAEDYKTTKMRGMALIGLAAGGGGIASKIFEFIFAAPPGP